MSNLINFKSVGKVRIGVFLTIFILLVSLGVVLFSYFAFANEEQRIDEAVHPGFSAAQEAPNTSETKCDADVYVQNSEKEALEDAVVNGTEQNVRALTNQDTISKTSNEEIEWTDWNDSRSLPSSEDPKANYRLKENVTLSLNGWIVPYDIKLDLNGHTISAGPLRDTQSLITNNSGQTLEIYDTSSSKSGKVDLSTFRLGGVSVINNSGTLIIYGGTYTGGQAERGAGIYNSGYFVMHDGTISENSTSNDGSGGGVFCDNGIFVFEKGSITNNSSVYGAGVYLRNSSLKIYNGSISNNSYICEGEDSTAVYGVGIYSYNSSIVMHGGDISNNVGCAITAYGIGLYNEGTTFIMYDGSISGNEYYSNSTSTDPSPVCYGVGLYSKGWLEHGEGEYPLRGTVMMYSGEISNNSTKVHTVANNFYVYGAGVYIYSAEHNGNYSVFKTAGGKITKNGIAPSNYAYRGAGIFAGYACLVDMSNTEISYNGAFSTFEDSDGGGIYLSYYFDEDLICNLHDVKLHHNKANYGAGIACYDDVTLNIYGSTEISYNDSQGDGPAGIYVYYATLNWYGGSIHDNNGIGLYYWPNSWYMRHCMLFDGEVSVYNNSYNGQSMNMYLMSGSWPINIGENFSVPSDKKIGFTYIEYPAAPGLSKTEVTNGSYMLTYNFSNVLPDVEISNIPFTYEGSNNPTISFQTYSYDEDAYDIKVDYDNSAEEEDEPIVRNYPPTHDWTDQTALPVTGGSYKLTVDVNLSTKQSFTLTADSYIDLNGHNISRAEGYSLDCLIELKDLGENALTIYDSTVSSEEDVSGSIDGRIYDTSRSSPRGIWVQNSEINLDSITVKNCSHSEGAALRVENNSKADLINYTKIGLENEMNYSPTSGGGVYVTNGSTLNICDYSCVQNNFANTDAGGIYLQNSSCYVSGNSFIGNNTANREGGGIEIGYSAQLILSDNSSIYHNTAVYGAGVYNYSSTFDMYDASSVSKNTAMYHGGGIYSQNGTINLYSGEISENEIVNNGEVTQGAGIYINRGYLYCYGGEIWGNSTHNVWDNNYMTGGGVYSTFSEIHTYNLKVHNNSSYFGGGFYLHDTYCVFDFGTEIYGNVGYNGGAMYVCGKSDFFANNIKFHDNWAICRQHISEHEVSYSGGIGAVISTNRELPKDLPIPNPCTASFTNCEIYTNTAEICGGVGHNDGFCGMNFTKCNIHDNMAENKYSADVTGGAFDNYGNLDFDHSILNNNTASLKSISYGGAVANWCVVNVNDSEITNNSAYMGAGIYNGPSLYKDKEDSKAVIFNSKINNNNASWYGGILNQEGLVFVTKCEIIENVAKAGAGVANFSNTYLFDNKISKNVSDSYGAGVYNTAYMEIDSIEVTENDGTGMVLDSASSTWMCGKVICKNNTCEAPAFVEADYAANCILYQGQYIWVDEPTGFTAGTDLHYDIVGENALGDFVEVPGRATLYYGKVNSSADLDTYLHYDALGHQSWGSAEEPDPSIHEEIWAVLHQHEWHYEAGSEDTGDENTIYCWCENEGEQCPHHDKDTALKLIINAELTLYTGKEVKATIEDEIAAYQGVVPRSILYTDLNSGEPLASAPSECGKYKASATITLEDGTTYTAYKDFRIVLALDKLMVKFDKNPATYAYTGSKITPEITVWDEEKDITDDVVISGETSATKVGTYIVTVDGNDESASGKYFGQTWAMWSITPGGEQIQLTDDMLVIEGGPYPYDGEMKAPEIKIKYGDTEIPQEYVDIFGVTEAQEVGAYPIVVLGQDYAKASNEYLSPNNKLNTANDEAVPVIVGRAAAAWMIYVQGSGDKALTSEMLTISPASFTYDGADKAPTITVVDGDVDLVAAGAVTISGDLMSSVVGSHAVTVSAKSGSGYTGSIAGTWLIDGGASPVDPVINPNAVAQTFDSLPLSVIGIELGIAICAFIVFLAMRYRALKHT